MCIEPRKFIFLVALAGCLALTGCRTPDCHREEADRTAYSIIDAARKSLEEEVDVTEKLRVEAPAVTLRRRLIEIQMLPAYSSATLGSSELEPAPHWPELIPKYAAETNTVPLRWSADNGPISIALLDAIQIAARNRREYQSSKEDVFKAALDLDLSRNSYRATIEGSLDGSLSSDNSGDEAVEGAEGGFATSISKTLTSGLSLSGVLLVDVAKLLTGDRESAWGIAADASISIPLLRGAGKHIARESLTQAERDLIYAIYDFEITKQKLAVSIAREYLGVLQADDQAHNAQRNYDTISTSAERAASMARAGRLPEVQVDQAHQDQLRAYDRAEVASQRAEQELDQFKVSLGLPPDARIVLDRDAFTTLIRNASNPKTLKSRLPGDEEAVLMALENRLDLRTAVAKVEDAQRAVVIAADNLRGEVTLLGSASAGGRRSASSAAQGDAELDISKGILSSVINIDLPLERTSERVAFRKQLLSLDQSIRSAQSIEDSIKLQVRNRLREMKRSSESIQTQMEAVRLAERRQHSTDLFLKAGRAEMRDLLDAEESLLSVRNALTDAIISYRISELQLQQDLGILRVTDSGLVKEASVADYFKMSSDGSSKIDE